MAKLLIDIDSGKLALDEQTMIIVDEAGMIGTADMDRLLSACVESGARVLLQEIVLLLGVMTVVGTFISDLVLMWVDPRIRHQMD